MDGFLTPALRGEHLDPGTTTAADAPATPRCAAILTADALGRAASLEAALGALEGTAVVVRVGNPLSAKLSLHRMLIQIGAEDAIEDADEDAEATLARLLDSRRGAHGRVVLVVEQAETLHPAALLSLQRIASAPGPVKFLFVGKPAFLALLDRAELAPLRRALSLGAPERAIAATAPAPIVASPFLVAPTLPGSAPPSELLPAEGARHTDATASAWVATACPAPVFVARPSVTGPTPATSFQVSGTPVTPVLVVEPEAAVATQSGQRWWVAAAVGLVASLTLAAAAVFAPGGFFYRSAPQRLPSAVPNMAAPAQWADPPAEAQPAPPASASRTEVGARPPQSTAGERLPRPAPAAAARTSPAQPPTPAAPEPAPARLPPIAAPALPPSTLPSSAAPPHPSSSQAGPPAAPDAPATSLGALRARLEAEFNRFLHASGHDPAALGGAELEALFNEFLSQRSRAAVARPLPLPAPPPPSGRVAGGRTSAEPGTFRGTTFNETLNFQGGLRLAVTRIGPGDVVVVRFEAYGGLVGAGQLTGHLSADGRLVASGTLMMGANPFATELEGTISGDQLAGTARYSRVVEPGGRASNTRGTFRLTRS